MSFNNFGYVRIKACQGLTGRIRPAPKEAGAAVEMIERFNQDPQTIVVVPSMSIDAISSGAVMQAYEERFLFLLLLLRQPRARLIYVTSQTILRASSIIT